MELSKPVLVVEDDAVTREAIKLILESAGLRVETAVDGKQALDYLYCHDPAALIVLDLMMPVMDGRDFLKRRQRLPIWSSVPVVIVSAYGEDARAVACAEGLMFVPKPFEVEHLLAVVTQAGRFGS